MWHTYYAPSTLAEVLALRDRYRDAGRIIAGGTDLILEMERGVRQPEALIDITRVSGLDRIVAEDGELQLGPLVTHNQAAGAAEVVAGAFPLARACWQVGAPQIRNRGTVAGNLITASPANDAITPLWAMDATVTLASAARGRRTLRFDEFFLGVRHTALQDDEVLVSINVPVLKPSERGTFLKFGLRQAQAISVVNLAVIVDWDDYSETRHPQSAIPETADRTVRGAKIALGAVAPTILRVGEAEAFLVGRSLTDEVITQAAELAARAARPISDVRASAEYRLALVRALTAQALRQLCDGTERADWPSRLAMLWGGTDGRFPARAHAAEFGKAASSAIRLVINGVPTVLPKAHGKTLLRALREDAEQIGTKEGCAEGECGACTVWLDGIAVMACLVPAERADGCEVVTVEGLAMPDGQLHPLQDAFIRAGAVQCGYCTPGVLMATVNLLTEIPHPTPEQVKDALSGNLCRCTGYYSILQAVERAVAR
jgi:xanthine dehydrogenase iron-sulfur cluster and FAD-binding subunit A